MTLSTAFGTATLNISVLSSATRSDLDAAGTVGSHYLCAAPDMLEKNALNRGLSEYSLPH